MWRAGLITWRKRNVLRQSRWQDREGALIGMLACQNRPKVKGYISIAGAVVLVYEIIEAQVAAQQNPEWCGRRWHPLTSPLKNGTGSEWCRLICNHCIGLLFRAYMISWFKYNPGRWFSRQSAGPSLFRVKWYSGIGGGCRISERLPTAELLLIDKMNLCAEKIVNQRPYSSRCLLTGILLCRCGNGTLIASVSTFVEKLKWYGRNKRNVCRCNALRVMHRWGWAGFSAKSAHGGVQGILNCLCWHGFRIRNSSLFLLLSNRAEAWKDMAKSMGVSYPTVRNILDDLIDKLSKNEWVMGNRW